MRAWFGTFGVCQGNGRMLGCPVVCSTVQVGGEALCVLGFVFFFACAFSGWKEVCFFFLFPWVDKVVCAIKGKCAYDAPAVCINACIYLLAYVTSEARDTLMYVASGPLSS